MKTTKINRIELDPKDSNVQIVIGNGIMTINVLPDGRPVVEIATDYEYCCGHPYLSLEADVQEIEANPNGTGRFLERSIETAEYIYGACISFPKRWIEKPD